MTEEYQKRMDETLKKLVDNRTKRQLKILEDIKNNQKYINLYTDFIFAVIETYDFDKNKFNIEYIDEDVKKTMGYPKDIFVHIDNENKTADIVLDYGSRTGWRREGEPSFKTESDFKLSVINTILEENDISIKESHVDGGGIGRECDYITFNASSLLSTREQLLNTEQAQKKKVY